jgi:xanthine dehydrogenase molybdopterin-binding subunit B
VGAVAGHPAGKTHSGCNSNQDAFRLRRLDLEALRAEPGLIEELSVEDLPALLEICAVEHGRVAAVERLAHGRLARELPDLTRATEGLLTARQAARRLGVSVDYLRDHGEALRLAVPLDGVVRYDPVAIDRLRRQRRDQLPRD